MHVELDHFFVCVSPGGSEADALVAFGLTEGAANRHPGQGTANRRFFFHNAFFELLWVDDEREAQSPLVARTRLFERAAQRGRGASPFGVCVRPAHGETGDPPFATWEYRPPYLPEPLVIQMAASSEIAAEPLLFFVAFGHRPDADVPGRKQPIEHAAGLRTLTRLRLAAPAYPSASHELHALDRACPWLSFAAGADEPMEVGFDGETAGHSHDFRPALPLVFRW